MGDFALDTTIEPLGHGRYRATLNPDWQIWGPMGGYVAAIAMRAAGAEATLPRPASFFCHYLSATRFEPIDLRVTPIRRGGSAESLRVVVSQGDRDVMDATVWVVREGDGLTHEVTTCPDVPGFDELTSLAEWFADERNERPGSPFWSNFDARPVEPWSNEAPAGPDDPVWRQWQRFDPASTFEDVWIDAARYVLLCDLPSWPCVHAHHGWKWDAGPPGFIAPTLDLYVAFHRLVPDEPWLLVDGYAPVAADGLLGCSCRLWSSTGQLVASGGGQGLFRRV